MALNRFTVSVLFYSLGFMSVSARDVFTFDSGSKLEGLVPCQDDDDCSDLKNATCSEEKLCECNHAIFICEEVTYPKTNRIGGRCRESKNCNVNDSECGPLKNCVCKSGYVSSSNRRKCLKKAKKLGDFCEEHSQCSREIGSSVCFNNKCACRTGTHEYKGSCFKTAALGASCARHEECSSTASSSCINSKCSCMETHVAINLKCLQTAQDIGDSCEEDVQCTTTFGDGSHCFQETCQCKELYHYKDKNNTCVRDILLNEICRENSDCHQPGQESSRLMCMLGVCKCQSRYREEYGYCEDVGSGAEGLSSFYSRRPEIFTLYVFVSCIVVTLFSNF